MSASPESAGEAALFELTRDLAETFKVHIREHPQFEGTLGWIELLGLDSAIEGGQVTLRRRWRV